MSVVIEASHANPTQEQTVAQATVNPKRRRGKRPIAKSVERADSPIHTRAFHIERAKAFSPDWVESIAEVLAPHGYDPMFSKAEAQLKEKLSPLQMVVPRSWVGPGVEAYVNSDSQNAVLVRRIDPGMARRRRGAAHEGEAVDFLAVGPLGVTICPELASEIAQLLRGDFNPRSWRESRLVENLTTKLGSQSQNGKLLAETQIRAACRDLANDAKRENLSAIKSAFGVSSVPRTAYVRLERFENDLSTLDALLADADVMQQMFSVVCSGCDSPLMSFQEHSEASSVAGSGGTRCVHCGNSDLLVQPTFAVSPSHSKSLAQGLWLESLAADSVEPFASDIWIGQMIESDEVDVLAVVFDQVVLIECKDTSFGQNDLYVTSAKAENVGASSVIVISTRDVHPNVTEAVDRTTKGRDDRLYGRASRSRKFDIISERSGAAIQSRLSDALEDRGKRHRRGWLTVDPYDYYEW